jgi:hypothetical protein
MTFDHSKVSSWVASKLQFGLGNRLFQLASAHTLSETWSVPLVFAMPYCLPSEHGDFNTIFKMFPKVEKVWSASPELAIEQKSVFQYEPMPTMPPARKVLLKGMWQAAEYVSDSFKASWDAVAEKDTLLKRWHLETTQQRAKTAFIHIRLGDFKILPHHQVNLLSYIAVSMERFAEDTRFLVFSDTMEEAKNYSVFNDRCVFVNELDEYHALFLMSRCQAGAITANSTFSWWGAFFGRQAALEEGLEYRAYMPSKWMAEGGPPESSNPIYPPWATVVSV